MGLLWHDNENDSTNFLHILYLHSRKFPHELYFMYRLFQIAQFYCKCFEQSRLNSNQYSQHHTASHVTIKHVLTCILKTEERYKFSHLMYPSAASAAICTDSPWRTADESWENWRKSASLQLSPSSWAGCRRKQLCHRTVPSRTTWLHHLAAASNNATISDQHGQPNFLSLPATKFPISSFTTN